MKMDKDASDFMILEYDRISTAYFGLRDQVNEWFKNYVTLIGLPLTILAAVARIVGGSSYIGLANLPTIVSALLAVVSLLGIFVTFSIINLRMEMIMYARTINDIRRFFADMDKSSSPRSQQSGLAKYLILPTSDAQPPFFEFGRAMFYQVMMIGVLDGLIFMVATKNLSQFGWFWCALAAFLFAGIHLTIYKVTAERRETEWKIRFKDNLEISNF